MVLEMVLEVPEIERKYRGDKLPGTVFGAGGPAAALADDVSQYAFWSERTIEFHCASGISAGLLYTKMRISLSRPSFLGGVTKRFSAF